MRMHLLGKYVSKLSTPETDFYFPTLSSTKLTQKVYKMYIKIYYIM